MRNLATLLMVSSVLLLSAPCALADTVTTTEYHALMTPNRQVEIVDTIPQTLPTGYTVINSGAVVTPGQTLVIPDQGSVVVPDQLHSHMKLKMKIKD